MTQASDAALNPSQQLWLLPGGANEAEVIQTQARLPQPGEMLATAWRPDLGCQWLGVGAFFPQPVLEF